MIKHAFYFMVPAVAAVLVLVTGSDGADKQPSAARRKLTKADFEAMMQSLSNWGRWGPQDQLGALNLITPEKRRQAAALVKDGVTVSLAHHVVKEYLDESPEFVHRMTLPKHGQEFGSSSDEYSVKYHGFTQSHLDGLCHMIYKGKMYNGFSQDVITAKGAGKLGIQNFKNGIFTRCVLMDIPRLLGARFLQGDRAIFPEDLDAWERRAGVKVESGDVVLIRTGRWTRRQLEGPWNIMKGSAGLHASCVPWLKKRDVAVIGSDLALDALPSRVEGVEMPVHWLCVAALGMPILDNCDFEEVSEAANARKRWSFLLTVAPLCVDGGTGSPVNPLATF